ncbi:DUF2231 domain-containing protein [Actinomycetospora sp. C-140]
MSVVNGLPAHVLLVHAVVVLVPLTALLLVAVAVWPAARARLSWLTAALAVLTLVSVPLTTEAGEWLEHRVPSSPLVHEHTELGDGMLPWSVGLAVLALVVLGRRLAAHRLTRPHDGPGAASSLTRHRSDQGEPGGLVVGVIVGLIAVVVAGGSVLAVYRIGESGARAAWTGQFSSQPISDRGAAEPGAPAAVPQGGGAAQPPAGATAPPTAPGTAGTGDADDDG